MSVDSTRRNIKYAANGVLKTFAFHFKLFNASAASVSVGAPTSSTSTKLTYGTDYSVSLNADQETNPGGTVTLTTAPATGNNVAIISEEAYTQPMVLTPYDGFNPETLNDNADLQAIQIQQLKELSDRHLAIPATSTKTADQVMSDVLNTAANAATYATQAATTLAQTQVVKSEVDAIKVSVTASASTVQTLAAQVATKTDQILALEDTLDAVADIADDISEVADHADEVHAVGQDLLGLNITSVDLGLVTEDADPINDSDSSLIGQIIEHIDDVGDVADNITAVTTDATNIESIRLVAADLGAELEYTFRHDFGKWGVDDTVQELDGTGSISTVASKINAVENVSTNMSSVTQAVTAAATATQAASSALAAEARIQALEDQINEIISTNYVAVAEETD